MGAMTFRAGAIRGSVLGVVLLLAVPGCQGRHQTETRAQATKGAPKSEEACDGEGWCRSKVPSAGLGGGARAVWAASPTDVWAVGTTVVHWDGVRWSLSKEALKPSQGTHPDVFRAIHGAGPDAVWAVGSSKALFWDGKKHSEYALPFDASAVFTIAKNDAWIVGQKGDIARWNGSEWAAVRAPVLLTLNSVYCARTDDCWAAGDGADDDVRPSDSSRLLHWDGKAWQERRIGMSGIRALGGTASDDVWAAGPWGRIQHFDGQRWASVSSPAQRTLYRIRAAARDDVWATGDDGLVMHFDGKAWCAAQPTWPRIEDLSSVSAHELWAVSGEVFLHWRAASLRPASKLSRDLWDPTRPTPSQQRLEDAERERLARYRERIGAGRAATRAAKYELAASAFTAALEAKPGDARAYSERGYAAYLAKNFSEAQLDLERAAEHADERSLRAQTFFNLGLVREAQGKDGTSAFALSNFLHSTPAAKEHLVGKNSCAVEIDRSASAITFRAYPDWQALYGEIGPELGLYDKVTTSGGARKLLCQLWQPDPHAPKADGCTGPSPWVIPDNQKSAFVVIQTAEGLWAAAASRADAPMFCPFNASTEIVHRSPTTVVFRAFGGAGTDVLACDDDGHECTREDEADLERDPESHAWVHGCNWQGYEKFEVLDLTTRTFPLIVTQFDESNRSAKDSEQVQIHVDARGIALKGPGCDELLPLPGGG